MQNGFGISKSSGSDSDLGYLVYTALLTQQGTNAPVATILGTNTIGTIVWTYDSVGFFYGTLTGAFPANRTTWVIGNATSQSIPAYQVQIDTADRFGLFTSIDYLNAFADGFNGCLDQTMIEIRVYPAA